jgi:hypothetical protein
MAKITDAMVPLPLPDVVSSYETLAGTLKLMNSSHTNASSTT